MSGNSAADPRDKYRAGLWPLPPALHTGHGEPRRLGVELEFAGLDMDEIVALCQRVLGGEIQRVSDYEVLLATPQLGEFRIELDFAYLKQLGREREPRLEIESLDDLADELAEGVLALLAKQLVPYEIVSPPIPMAELWRLESLITELRLAGAKGTRHAMAYAFGLHLNPELPGEDAATITAYLQAFLCLYPWLVERGDVDLSRRVTPYIDPFDKAYMRKVLAADYSPDLDTLVDDYLQHNATRNRALDMLPLFKHLDEQRVLAKVKDKRVNARPTLHYRLPNCQIDEANWALVHPWRDWLQVDALAGDAERLSQVREAYLKLLGSTASGLFQDWPAQVSRWALPELL